MGSVAQLSERLATGEPLTESEIAHWIGESDSINEAVFFGSDSVAAKAHVTVIAKNAIQKYLNNPNTEAVTLRCKTQICLILANISLNASTRSVIFDALGSLVGVFEEAMTQEGKQKFDPELGRMTEHVIVLVMRVTNYKLQAAGMFEFVEGKFQFAVQLLLAVLLKMPAYELELRCCCLRCLHGFTQPQAFFTPNARIEETSCTEFTEKIDFTLDLMLRMEAVQVVSDVLTEALDASQGAVPPVVHDAICSMMRCILNIFQFSSTNAERWRQHILLSTSLVDCPLSTYMHCQTKAFLSLDTAANMLRHSEVIKGLTLGFKFGGYATFHLGNSAREVRAFSTYVLNLLVFNVSIVSRQEAVLKLVISMYARLLQFLCNIDALTPGSDFDYPNAPGADANISTPIFTSHVKNFIYHFMTTLGGAQIQVLQKAFRTIGADALVAQDSHTFKEINGMLQAAATQTPPAGASSSAPPQSGRSHLGQMPPPVKAHVTPKISIEKAGVPTAMQSKISVVKQDAASDLYASVEKELLCALTGNIIKNPVISPYGHTFDKSAIDQWLQQNGSICPITGKPLTASDMRPNKTVAAKIMKQAIQQSMTASNNANDDDLYDF